MVQMKRSAPERRIKPQQKIKNAAVPPSTTEPRALPLVRMIISPRPSPLCRSAKNADKNHTYKTRNGSATMGATQLALPAV